MDKVIVTKFVKLEDLNHHQTLFAGRIAEWFVESSFICAAKAIKSSESLVCAGIRDISITRPVKAGDILDYECTITTTGKTSITVHAILSSGLTGAEIGEGTAVFVNLDQDGKPEPHGL